MCMMRVEIRRKHLYVRRVVLWCARGLSTHAAIRKNTSLPLYELLPWQRRNAARILKGCPLNMPAYLCSQRRLTSHMYTTSSRSGSGPMGTAPNEREPRACNPSLIQVSTDLSLRSGATAPHSLDPKVIQERL